MGAIADQLAAKLPTASIRMKSHVRTVQDGFVIMDDGDTMAAPIIVVATEGPEAAKLLGEEIQTTPARSVLCVYYAAQKAPFEEPMLVLNGDGKGCVNNVCVPHMSLARTLPKGSISYRFRYSTIGMKTRTVKSMMKCVKT